MPTAAGDWPTTATSGFSKDVSVPRTETPPAFASPAGAGFPFVGGKKTTLERLFREKGIILTAEAQASFDALPERFLDWYGGLLRKS